MDAVDRVTGLEVDIDTRVQDVWTEFYGSPLDTDDLDALAVFGACIRVAYARGYIDALKEEREGRRGELPLSHGYRAP